MLKNIAEIMFEIYSQIWLVEFDFVCDVIVWNFYLRLNQTNNLSAAISNK